MFCLHHEPGAQGQKRALDFMELELQLFVRYHVGAENQTGSSARTNAINGSIQTFALRVLTGYHSLCSLIKGRPYPDGGGAHL